MNRRANWALANQTGPLVSILGGAVFAHPPEGEGPERRQGFARRVVRPEGFEHVGPDDGIAGRPLTADQPVLISLRRP
jgi:hypothetical protein